MNGVLSSLYESICKLFRYGRAPRIPESQNPKNLASPTFIQATSKASFYNEHSSYLVFLYFVPLILVPFSPFYSYMIAVFLMIGLSRYITKEYRILLGLILVFDIAVIYGSKVYFNTATDFDDDFSRYYQNYLDIYDGIENAMFAWGGGFEIGLPLFYKILSLIFPRLLPQSVLFLTALSVGLLFYIWLEVYAIKLFKPYQRAALVAFAMFIDVFMESIGLTRQCFSSVFLLYAIFSKNIPHKLLFFIIASFFHISAILVFAGFYCLRYFPKVSLFIFTILLVVFIQDSSGLNSMFNATANTLQNFIPQKIFIYFSKHYTDPEGWDPYFYIYAPIMKLILMFCIIFSMYVLLPNDKLARYFRNVVAVCFVIFITHIFPTRSVALVTDLLFYFIAFIAFRRFFNLTLLFFFPYFLKRMYFWLSSDFVPDKASWLFFSYPESSFYPFYYLFTGVLL